MKAIAVFPGTHEIKLIEHEEPHITRPMEVKVRMLEVGVCGTDREICSFEYGVPPVGSDYLIIGHESLGEVVEVGPAADGLAVGDLVVTMVRRPCPQRSVFPADLATRTSASPETTPSAASKGATALWQSMWWTRRNTCMSRPEKCVMSPFSSNP